MKMRDSRRRREGDPICRSGLIAAPRQRIAAQLAAYRRGASPDDPADLTTRCAGFIKPRHLNALVQVELIILRSHCNSGLCRRCTWRVNLGGSEGSVEQSRDSMDKNRIGGLPGRTSEQVIAKSTVIKGRGGKSGGCAAKAVGLTSGGPRRVRHTGLSGQRCPRSRRGSSYVRDVKTKAGRIVLPLQVILELYRRPMRTAGSMDDG